MSISLNNLDNLAEQVMLEKGLVPTFSQEELQQLAHITEPAPQPPQSIDLRSLHWCSIDNDTSRDLDQLTYAEKNGGKTTLWVAIADVDALVAKGSPIDQHAQKNTTSVYTPTKTFSMLPERLSTHLTSLNEQENRMAMVVKIGLNQAGEVEDSSIFRAMVHNYAQLTYHLVGGWLAGSNDLPEKAKRVVGLDKTLRCQHEIAQILKEKRQGLGSLILEPIQIEPRVGSDGTMVLAPSERNFAHQLIEEFMIAANVEVARHFQTAKIPSISRVVRQPKRWERIVQMARELGETLPLQPDALALADFLVKRKKADPVSFPDLSLTVIKLLGRGEYVLIQPGEKPVGHFGLALPNYTHSTAPNRRFPDLIAQRQYKAYLLKNPLPYTANELSHLANHCTEQEDAATKVERRLNKSAAAIILSNRLGTTFKGIITGASEKGTWVRLFDPPIEGKVVKGFENLDVGDHVKVKLVHVDIPKGYIDFIRA